MSTSTRSSRASVSAVARSWRRLIRRSRTMAELEQLFTEFVGAPPRTWDAAAYKGSSAERIADALDRSFRGQAGLWPAVLPRLRDRARLTRGALVERLAEAL